MDALSAMIASGVVVVAQAAAPVDMPVSPRGAALAALNKPITVAFDDARLEDVVAFIENYAGVVIRGMWADERFANGLERGIRVSVDVRDGTVRDLIEDALEFASDGFEEATWQVSARGELQIGPRSRLNRYQETRRYDVNDLLFRLPDFEDVPELDIDKVLQQGGGDGGGGSIFRNTEAESEPELGEKKDLAEELAKLIYELVESDQWQVNGGEGGVIRIYEGYLIIRAPGYMHRQLEGPADLPAGR